MCFASTSLTTWRGKSTWEKNQVEYGAFKWTFKCQTGGVHIHWNVSGSVHQTAPNNNLKRKSLESLKSLRWWSEALEREKKKEKKRSYFGNISFRILPCRLSLSPLFNDMLQNFVSWMPWEEEGGEIRRRGKKKTCPTPFLKISFFRQKRSSRGKPCLPDCLPRTSCCCRRGDVVVRGVEATVCGRLKPAGSRLRQINEKEGRLRAVREWSYFGFPFFGVERYSLVVSCWRRRVSWVASSSGGKKRGRGSRRRADARRSSRANWRLLPLSGGLCRLLSKCPWEQKTERNAGR